MSFSAAYEVAPYGAVNYARSGGGSNTYGVTTGEASTLSDSITNQEIFNNLISESSTLQYGAWQGYKTFNSVYAAAYYGNAEYGTTSIGLRNTHNVTTGDSVTAADVEVVTVTYNVSTSDSITAYYGAWQKYYTVYSGLYAYQPYGNIEYGASSFGLLNVHNVTTGDSVTASDSDATQVNWGPTTNDSLTAYYGNIPGQFTLTSIYAVAPYSYIPYGKPINLVRHTYDDYISDSVTAADSLTAFFIFNDPITENLTATDDVSNNTVIYYSTTSDNATLSDTEVGSNSISVTTSDSITAADSVTAYSTISATTSDTITASDSLANSLDTFDVTSDLITASDSSTVGVTFSVSTNDGLSALDSLANYLITYDVTSDNITATDSLFVSVSIQASISDNLVASDSLFENVDFNVTTSDTITASDSLTAGVSFFAPTNDSLTASDSLVEYLTMNEYTSDTIVASDSYLGGLFRPVNPYIVAQEIRVETVVDDRGFVVSKEIQSYEVEDERDFIVNNEDRTF